MSVHFPRRTTSLKVLTSLVGILSIGSLVSLPAFSQSNDSPSDARTLPRGTTDAPLPRSSDAQNNYPVNQNDNSPSRMNQDGTIAPNSNNQRDLNSPARTNQDGTVFPDSNNQRDLNSPARTNQDGTVFPDSNNQRDLNSPARTNQDGTILPNSNNQGETNRSPNFNDQEGFNGGSGSNDLQRTTAGPFPNPNIPYDPNLTPRQNINQEGGSQQ